MNDFGEPDDVSGECNADLYLADDFGDNHVTIRCQLPKGHDGCHEERCREGTVTIQWDEDERKQDLQLNGLRYIKSHENFGSGLK